MGRFIDLTGRRFGKLVVVERDTTVVGGRLRYWVCKCDCGNTCKTRVDNLTNGESSSCGCSYKYKNFRKPGSIDEETKSELVSKYQSGESTLTLTKIFNISGDSIRRFCESLGLPMRGYKAAAHRYYVNENFFETIDTEEKAYWLGFIAADGNVGGTSLKIMLKLSDAGHLEKFKKSIESEHKIRIEQKYNRCSISLRSEKIVGDLKKYGITENKSLTLKVNLNPVPRRLHKHFWRGMVDGDGYIPKKGRTSVFLCGTPDVVEMFKAFSMATQKVQYKNSNHCRLDVSGDLARKLAWTLYGNCTVSLDRKQFLAERLYS
jgi:hypothetical protein